MSKPAYWYQQSAVIPYRLTAQSATEPPGVEILLITSRKRRRWVIPKGIVEPGLSPLASAVKEAYEEAGIRGIPSDAAVGSYEYEKWGGRCRVAVFLLEVTEELAAWPEDRLRDRAWLPVAEAARRVREPELQHMFRNLAQ
jgi:8-oxo-dGTP pyrophosphatase MutT (NUDIX family)